MTQKEVNQKNANKAYDDPATLGAGTDNADRSVWLIWMGLVLVAVAVLPFALRNADVLRQIAAMCGFDLR
ncbi:MAG: hypothetical protein VW472_03390 [Candidatus Puniceispirillum sp.]